jgi:hypothetical protein
VHLPLLESSGMRPRDSRAVAAVTSAQGREGADYCPAALLGKQGGAVARVRIWFAFLTMAPFKFEGTRKSTKPQ